MTIDTPIYGYVAPNGAFLSITPQPDGRPLVEVCADDGHATSVLLYLHSDTATAFADDVDRATQAAATGDTTVRNSWPRVDVSGDSIHVVPGPDDGGVPRITITADEECCGDPVSVAVEMPLDAATALTKAIRTAAEETAR